MTTSGFHADTHGLTGYEPNLTSIQHSVTSEMSRAEMLASMDALEQRAEQSWTSHQVTVLDEMKSAAGGALEIEQQYAQ